jgi:pimeloyl-ACP methyl ester carboxylesterase
MPKAMVNGINMYYEVHGQGEPLVLTMGSFGPHQGWFFQTRAFKKYYKVIVFDNRGIGRTEKSPEPYSISTMADDTVGLMSHLGIDKAHVLGMSLGGAVAQHIAVNYPQRVQKLVLVCSGSGAEDAIHVHPEMLEVLGVKEGSREVDLRSLDFRKVMRTIVMLSFNKRLYRMFIVPLAEYWFKRFNVEDFLKQLEAVRGYSALDRLHQIRAQTLVMTGAEDRIVNPHSSEVLASLIPNSRLVKVEGGSHAFYVESPCRFNKEVLNFLKAATK